MKAMNNAQADDVMTTATATTHEATVVHGDVGKQARCSCHPVVAIGHDETKPNPTTSTTGSISTPTPTDDLVNNANKKGELYNR